MRARQRHLNAGAAGATTVYDARFVYGVADGNGISTWSDRTNNNDATQGTATYQPTFQEAELGGNPVVRFDGSNDRMEHGLTLDDCLVLWVGNTTNNGVEQRVFGSGVGAGATAYTFIGNRSNIVQFASNNFASASFNSHTSGIVSWSINGTNVTFARNGGSSSTSSFAKYTGTTASQSYASLGSGGATPTARSQFLNGDIGCVVVFAETVSDPMRRRLERGAGFVWKISCN